MPRPTIKFYLLSRVQLKGRGIMMRVSCQSKGEPVHFYTARVIDPKAWDEKKQRVNSRYLLATVINSFLDTWQVEMEGLITNLELKAKPYTLKELQQAFNKRFRERVGKSDWRPLLIDFPEWLRKGGRKPSTLKHHKSRIGQFAKFMTGNITTERLHDFVDYMFDVERLEPSSIEKRLDTVRLFLRYLKENDFEVPEGYTPRRKIKLIEKPVVSLREEEYAQLMAHIPSTEKLQRIKDMAIILYNSGLRVSDSQISEEDMSKGIIVKMNQKTDKTVQIPIFPDLENILNKYIANGKPLPHISGQKLNDGLKELFKEAGLNRKVKIIHNNGGERTEEIKELWQVISSKKTGRAAFASYLEGLGLSDRLINLMLGHSTRKERHPYIDVGDIQKLLAEVKEKAKRKVG